jgi:syntaxin-binding protein 1
MLGSVNQETGPNQWSVLALDRVTTNIMSNIAGISDILDYGISLVEDVNVRREPLPHLNVIYFITPSDASITAMLKDWTSKEAKKGGKPPYRSAFAFFSSPLSGAQLAAIKTCTPLVVSLRGLREVNLEYCMIDKRTFTLCEDEALPALFANGVEGGEDCRHAISLLATRLATMFATMKECPSIRYRAALPPGDEYPPGLESRLLASQRLALELYDHLLSLQRAGLVPERETCDLIITDRGFDPVAPIIHEWTYEAMAHDLLEGTPSLESPNIFVHEVQTQGGKTEQREHPLDEKDKLFTELRHLHFAGASLKISQLLDEFRARNGMVQKGSGTGGGGGGGAPEVTLKSMSKVIQALPQYREQLTALNTHVELASKLNTAIDARDLVELGKLEQDLVYGDATSKEVVAFLTAHPNLPPTDKVRLLLCYSATHREKLDPTRESQWMKVAGLTPSDMAIIAHLEFLGVPVHKRTKGNTGVSFVGGRRRKRGLRKDREPDESEQQYSLSRFVPLLQEVLEDAVAGKLSQDEYPYIRTPTSPLAHATSSPNSTDCTPKAGGSSSNNNNNNILQGSGGSNNFGASLAVGQSVRTTGSWVKKLGGSGRSASFSDPAGAMPRGRRLFAFVLGGMTYSEMRVAHRLSTKLGRDVVLGSTGVETPAMFMRHSYQLGTDSPPRIGVFEIEGGGR